jgi:hypothetical protein
MALRLRHTRELMHLKQAASPRVPRSLASMYWRLRRAGYLTWGDTMAEPVRLTDAGRAKLAESIAEHERHGHFTEG